MEQRTPEWFEVRRGKVTASHMRDVTSKGRGSQPSKTRESYMTKLAVERLTGNVGDNFTSQFMQDGIDREPDAISNYEFYKNVDVDQIGFVDHFKIKMSGASPDGLIGEEGLIEVKCPKATTHFEYLKNKTIPSEYIKQMDWQLACTGRQWCDFVSFHPDFPEELQLLIIRHKRDDQAIKELEEAVQIFLDDLDKTVAELTDMRAAA